jgi:glycosyltransferase involved in cell wall biosynthesis
VRVLSVVVGASVRTGGATAFAAEAAVATSHAGGQSRVFATDLALAPWGWMQRQRLIRPDELHPSLTATDFELFPARFPRRLARSPAMARALRTEVPASDVVHIHNLWQYPQYAAFRAAREAQVPYIVSPHGSLDPYLRRRGRLRKAVTSALWHRELLEGAALIHVTTGAEMRLIADIAPGVPRAIVPCAINTADFGSLPHPEEFRERHLAGYSGPLVVFLGRVTEKKGVDVLLRSFARVLERQPARLAVVGPDDGGQRPGLERLAEQLGIGSRVDFVGGLYGRDRLAALSAADVWALSSHTENFGIAVIEAMAAGCPVAISREVNLAEEVADANAGLIAEAEPHAFAAALLELLSDARQRRRLSQAARKLAAGYDWSQVTPRLMAMYREAIGRERHDQGRPGEAGASASAAAQPGCGGRNAARCGSDAGSRGSERPPGSRPGTHGSGEPSGRTEPGSRRP